MAADTAFPSIAAEEGLPRAAADPVQKNLSFPATPEQQLPDVHQADAVTSKPEAASEEEILQALRQAVYWGNFLVSVTLCALGAFVFVLGDFILRGKHSTPLLSMLALGLLLELAINFLKSSLSSQWVDESAWIHSTAIKRLASSAEGAVLQIAALHDKFLSAKNPYTALKVAIFLWLITYVAHILSVWRLIGCLYFGAFAWGAVQTFGHEKLRGSWDRLAASVKEKWAALGVKRTHSGIAFAAAFLTLVYFSCWTTRLMTFFVGVLIVRCNLKPNEVKALATSGNEALAPYMRSARKQARRLSMVASDFVRRSSLGGKAHNR